MLLPAAAFAAPERSSADLLQSVASETKPMNFTLSSVATDAGNDTKVMLTGAREGRGPEKLWVRAAIDTKTNGTWMKAEVEVRYKGGKGYAMLRSVSGTDAAVHGLRSQAGVWYSLSDVSPSALAEWVNPAVDPQSLANAFAMSSTMFAEGRSYTLKADDNRTAGDMLSRLVPSSLRQPFPAGVSAVIKVDVNKDGAFQFASVASSSKLASATVKMDGKLQRQFSSVYVETPKVKVVSLPGDSALFGLLFGSCDCAVTPATDLDMSDTDDTASAPVSVTNYDSSSEMRLPPMGNPVESRLLRRQAERAIIHLLGPKSADLKLTVRLADKPVQWDSVSAFRFDFQRDSGILYVYPNDTTPSISAQSAFASLGVVFFDSAGRYVSSTLLKRCDTDSCTAVRPPSPVRYVLLVSESFYRRHAVDTLWRLQTGWYTLPSTVTTSSQEQDRAAKRSLQRRMEAAKPPRAVGTDTWDTSDEALKILAGLTAAKIRPADIRASATKRHDDAAERSIYAVLHDAISLNPMLYHAYVVRPTDVESTFALVVDNFTYAPLSELDLNGNGRVDPEEKPADLNVLYKFMPFIRAMKGVLVDTSSRGITTVYMPIVDENGNAIAVLTLVSTQHDVVQGPR